MSLALVPILAQAVAVGIGDRTELRYGVDRDGDTWEAETRPFAGLQLKWPRVSFGIGYTPSFTLAPLESPDRQLTILHVVGANLSFQVPGQYTTVTFSETASYTQENFAVQALAAPATPLPGDPGTGMMPDPAAPGGGTDPMPDPDPALEAQRAEVRLSRRTLQSGYARSDVTVEHRASRKVTAGGFAGYSVFGGLDDPSLEVYPILHGPDAGLSLAYAATARDTFTTSSHGQLFMDLDGRRVWIVTVDQGFRHLFSARASGTLAAGAAYTRVEPVDEPAEQGVYPTGLAAFDYVTRLEKGRLSLHLAVTSAPVVDRATVEIDPRLGLNAGLVWVRKRLTTYATSSAGISTRRSSPSALDSVDVQVGLSYLATERLTLYTYGDGRFAVRPSGAQRLENVGAGAGLVYELGAGFSADGGARVAFQRFEGDEIVPATLGAFVGLAWRAVLLQN